MCINSHTQESYLFNEKVISHSNRLTLWFESQTLVSLYPLYLSQCILHYVLLVGLQFSHPPKFSIREIYTQWKIAPTELTSSSRLSFGDTFEGEVCVLGRATFVCRIFLKDVHFGQSIWQIMRSTYWESLDGCVNHDSVKINIQLRLISLLSLLAVGCSALTKSYLVS